MQTTRQVIEAMGGRVPCAKRFGVTAQAVDKWQSNERFPGHLYFRVAEWAKEAGFELDPDLFHFERKPRRRKAEEPAVPAPLGPDPFDRKPKRGKEKQDATATQDG